MLLTTSIFFGLDGLSKTRKRFLIQYFSTLFSVRGKFNFTNMARYGDFLERTLRRNFRKTWDWVRLNLAIISGIDLGETIAAIDASAIAKSGKHTFGLGSF